MPVLQPVSTLSAEEKHSQREAHWEDLYAAKTETEVSWYQAEPALSLELIQAAAEPPDARIIDVGGGASVLVDRLLDRGYASVTVLDLSREALARSQRRLGERGARVDWRTGDITRLEELGVFDVWHDRAVFHFLTAPEEQERYLALAERSLPPGGHLLIATFALEGPERCSGLPVCRYDASMLARRVGPPFRLVRDARETHYTPWGAPQQFTCCLFQKTEGRRNSGPRGGLSPSP